MTSIDGTDVNINFTNPVVKSEIERKGKAGSARYTVHDLGLTNRMWSGTGWFNNETDRDFLEEKAALPSVTFIDKSSRTWTVKITEFEYDENTWAHSGYRIRMEEVE